MSAKELNIGDYVRTRDGNIAKYIRYDGFYIFDNYVLDETEGINNDLLNEIVIQSSPNIIDLIEVGDLVKIEYYSPRYKERVTRLFEVEYKDKRFMNFKNSHCDFMLQYNEFYEKDKELKPIIKSIVTREMFESIEYKIGE